MNIIHLYKPGFLSGGTGGHLPPLNFDSPPPDFDLPPPTSLLGQKANIHVNAKFYLKTCILLVWSCNVNNTLHSREVQFIGKVWNDCLLGNQLVMGKIFKVVDEIAKFTTLSILSWKCHWQWSIRNVIIRKKKQTSDSKWLRYNQSSHKVYTE